MLQLMDKKKTNIFMLNHFVYLDLCLLHGSKIILCMTVKLASGDCLDMTIAVD